MHGARPAAEAVEERALCHAEVGVVVVRGHTAFVTPPDFDSAPVRLQLGRSLVCVFGALSSGERDVPAGARGLGEELARAFSGSAFVVEDDQFDRHVWIVRDLRTPVTTLAPSCHKSADD